MFFSKGLNVKNPGWKEITIEKKAIPHHQEPWFEGIPNPLIPIL